LLAFVLLCAVVTDCSEGSGQDEKLLILIDKVLSYDTRPHIKPEHVKEIAEAGFNVVSPRWGGNDLGLVKDGAEMARQENIYFMPFIRGTGYTQEDARKMVWADGVMGTKALYSPNDDELWETITKTLVDHARISLEYPNLIGTFVDFENYDTHGGYGNCYSLSYDQKILDEFAKAKNIQMPKLKREERYPWLKDNGHHDAFARFQTDSWRQRCRTVRQAIDAVNPKLRLAVYPVPGTLFILEAVHPEWATAQAPLILADATTYGRPMGFLNDQEALRGNRMKMLEHMSFCRKYRMPFSYLGGIDPIVEPGDPEFFGKNADMLAAVTDGYWVFYEGPTYGQEDHAAMFRWFKRANDSIRSGRFNLHSQPREEPRPAEPVLAPHADDRPIVLCEGLNIGVIKKLRAFTSGQGALDVQYLQGFSRNYLANADVLLIQAATRWLDYKTDAAVILQDYVRNGGSLFMTHLGWKKSGCHDLKDATGKYIPHPHPPPAADFFPEIAVWSTPQEGKIQGRCLVDEPTLTVVAEHPIGGGLKKNDTFTTTSPRRMVLNTGAKGTIVLRDSHGHAVCVAGHYGKGKVVLSGCYYGYWTPGGSSQSENAAESKMFLGIVDWLVAEEKH
jgi:uncharacterized membrane protein